MIKNGVNLSRALVQAGERKGEKRCPSNFLPAARNGRALVTRRGRAYKHHRDRKADGSRKVRKAEGPVC